MQINNHQVEIDNNFFQREKKGGKENKDKKRRILRQTKIKDSLDFRSPCLNGELS